MVALKYVQSTKKGSYFDPQAAKEIKVKLIVFKIYNGRGLV